MTNYGQVKVLSLLSVKKTNHILRNATKNSFVIG